ncbi:mannosyltransferase [Aestuariibaculum marinum]|uniref:Mannosyltransferase n=1 Tax=Aestuariibaculum marinum TaxID=2683592 RepID=A0A8J6Q9L4_9FLAO|nr:mannosyltransferase [Aestuariibaculum marinum]MBD0823821.1 mannosyltransferase [Aestuariibaculum marinum]
MFSNLQIENNKNALILLAIASSVLYFIFAYDLVRTDYTKLLLLYSTLFLLFYSLVNYNKTNTKLLTGFAFGFRALFIFAIPNLSQDFYRFIWDGRLLLEGNNPYLFNVASFINNNEFQVAQAEELFKGMGKLNASHFTNYPPLNQLCFLIAALFAKTNILGSVVVMRLIIIAADFGTFYFGKQLLKVINKPVHNIFWYLLNPFIIIELTGNLHFEGVMVFFLIWSLYLLFKDHWILSAVTLGLSVSTKLIPLIFLPLLFQWFIIREISKTKGFLKLAGYYSISGVVIIISFLPFISSEFVNNYAQTVGLWFQRFEFNASLYYIARAIGYTFRGYNEIAIIGKYIPVLVILFVLIVTFFRNNRSIPLLISSMLFVLSFYYFTATTVHPWYIATLLILSVFTTYKFPLIWSFVIILSYLAYSNTADQENLWIIATEYLIVYAAFTCEVILKKPLGIKKSAII